MSDILIVDDERDIRELIADILQDEGFATRLAANSDEALASINAAQPALMILDIWLKDSRMDGIDILKQVKRNNPSVPVVIISGHGNIETAVSAIRRGVSPSVSYQRPVGRAPSTDPVQTTSSSSVREPTCRGSPVASSCTICHVPSGELSSTTSTSRRGSVASNSVTRGRIFPASLYVGSVARIFIAV